MTDERFWPPRSFAALPDEHSHFETARVVILPVPYDATASGWGGAREGPAAIIEASDNMELYDIAIGREPYLVGIHTLPELAAHAGGPEAMVGRTEEVAGELLDGGKFVVTLGGEHTVAVGPVRAHARRTPGLSVLALDAHADLRDSYMDTPYSHACTLRRGEAPVRLRGFTRWRSRSARSARSATGHAVPTTPSWNRVTEFLRSIGSIATR